MADVAYTRAGVPFTPARCWVEKLLIIESDLQGSVATCSYGKERGGWHPSMAIAAQVAWEKQLVATMETLADWGWSEDHPQFAAYGSIMAAQLTKLAITLPEWAIEARAIAHRHAQEYLDLVATVEAIGLLLGG